MAAGAGPIAVRTRPPARRVRTVVLLLVAVVALGASACSSGSSGLPASFADAIATMQETGGYTFTATVATGGAEPSVTVRGDFEAPNLVAQTVTRTGSAPVTMILDGGTVHLQDPATGTWSVQPSTTTATVDLRRAFGALSNAKDVKVEGSTATFTVDGDAARTLVGSDVDGRATVSITLGPVGLSRLTYRATTGGTAVVVTLDYTNVGSAPQVVVPT